VLGVCVSVQKDGAKSPDPRHLLHLSMTVMITDMSVEQRVGVLDNVSICVEGVLNIFIW